MSTQKKVFIQEYQQQMFQVAVRGLNVNSRMRVFYEGASVTPAKGVLTLPNDSTDLLTDNYGVLRFNYFYKDPSNYLNFTDEEGLFRFAAVNQGIKVLTVVDASSIPSNLYTELPENFKDLARCYAEVPIRISYVTQIKEINYSDYTETALSSSGVLQTQEYNAPVYWQNGSDSPSQIVLGT